jgi:hypothetical protein
MKVTDFKTLKNLIKGNPILLTQSVDYAMAIYYANIPYKPGVYLVYSLTEAGEDDTLLYIGKAGVTNKTNNPAINFHQLPLRLLAATKRPIEYTKSKSEFVTRAKLWPWYVDVKYKHGIKIYWFLTDWPSVNPNEIEAQLKSEMLDKNPNWKKSI